MCSSLMLIALPYMNTSLAIVLVPWAGWLRSGTCWAGLRILSALGEASEGQGGILQPSLASHSGSGHLGGCPSAPPTLHPPSPDARTGPPAS